MFFIAMQFAIGGWELPYGFSFLLPAAFPLIMAALTREEGDAGWAGLVLLVLLLPADVALYLGCNVYCRIIAASSEMPALWFVGWGVLHLLAVAALVRWIIYRRDSQRAES